MDFTRCSGVLLHPTSLPGPHGIGDLGSQAYRWIDWLSAAGCKLWQVLPLGPTGYGDSPYQCFSAFAGNPLLISPDLLIKEGFLDEQDLPTGAGLSNKRVDYGTVIPRKLELLRRVFARFTAPPGSRSGALKGLRTAFDSFRTENASWLNDYALFRAIKQAQGGGSWISWPEALRRREPSALAEARETLAGLMSRFSFEQFVFFHQWLRLKTYAHDKGIRIIGDVPIFVAHDSVDVWAHPDLFLLAQDGRPAVLAGVPPDYFSPTGQLWGNPLYRWSTLEDSGYAWWQNRLRSALRLVDIVRLDHFRGFAGCWEVPGDALSAEKGRWVPGPGADFFNVLEKNLGDLPFIAEDLGEITPDVIELRDRFGFPGMKVLQFAFSDPGNPFLPHNYERNCVVYTGTHDNDTARGWYESASEQEREFALSYLGVISRSGRRFAEALIRAAWSSVATFALAPMQDLLGLGSEARMNYPSRLGGNWTWRMAGNALSDDLQMRLKDLNSLYHR